ncbi:MAG: hypothetical protein ACU0CI_03240 [Shimia sp.]
MIRLAALLALLAGGAAAQDVPTVEPLQCFSLLQKSPIGRAGRGPAPTLSLTSVTDGLFEAPGRLTAAQPAPGTVSLQGSETVASGEVLGCVLRQMRVARQGGDDLVLFASDGGEGPQPQATPFPVLTFGIFPDTQAFQRAASAWDAEGGTLPLDAPIEAETRSIPLTAEHIGPVAFLDGAAPGSEGVTAIVLDDLYSQTLLAALDAEGARVPTLVLCKGGCEALRARAEAAPESVATPTEDAADTGEPTVEPEDTEPPNTAATDAPLPVPQPQDPEPATPDPAPTRLIARETPPPATPAENVLSARLSYLTPDGDESTTAIPALGGLACILDALGAEVFTTPPDCPGEAAQALAGLNALIEVAPDGRWIITPGAREAVARVVVTLPEGASAQTCILRIAGGTGAVAMEPVAGATPPRFTADVGGLPLTERGQARFRIETPTPGACGAPGRAIARPVAPEIVVALQEDALPRWAVVHLLAPHALDIAETLGPAPQTARAYAAALVDAVEGAHVRLHAATTQRPTTLSRAQVIALDGRASDTPRLSLSFEALRQAPGARFATLDAAARGTGGQARPVLSRDDLAARLSAQRAAASAAGETGVAVVLLGRIEAGTLADACAAPSLRAAMRDVATGPGAELRVAAFPLLRLSTDTLTLPEGARVIAPSRALGLGGGGGAGGLYACPAAEGVQVFPFVVEPWRPARDVVARYGAAVSDQLADYLYHLATTGIVE